MRFGRLPRTKRKTAFIFLVKSFYPRVQLDIVLRRIDNELRRLYSYYKYERKDGMDFHTYLVTSENTKRLHDLYEEADMLAGYINRYINDEKAE